jgi:hypothetical protein
MPWSIPSFRRRRRPRTLDLGDDAHELRWARLARSPAEAQAHACLTRASPACGAAHYLSPQRNLAWLFHHFSFDILWHASEHSGLAPGFLGTNCRLQTWHVFGSGLR